VIITVDSILNYKYSCSNDSRATYITYKSSVYKTAFTISFLILYIYQPTINNRQPYHLHSWI